MMRLPRTARAAMAQRAASQRLASERTWPLPVRGIYSKADRSEFNGTVAETLHNLRSNGAAIEMRDGYVQQGSSLAQQREMFDFGIYAGYVEILSDRARFGEIEYLRTFSGDVSVTSLSSNMLIADGAGPILRFDGDAFTPAEFTTDTLKNPDTFDGIFAHQDRVFAWDSSELAFYYGGVGAVTGQLVRFPLDRLGNITGKIVWISALTVNAGHGMNDVLAIMTSTGWIVFYEGLNPGDANDWRLLGRVKTAPPVSKYAVEQFGSDLWILTRRGLVSARETLLAGSAALVSAMGEAINADLISDVSAAAALPGWQIVTRKSGEEVIINVPTASGFKQYLYQIEDKAWSTADYPARWWHDLDGWTEFTAPDGLHHRLQAGVGDNGAMITGSIHSAWLRVRGVSSVDYLEPTIIGSGDLDVTIAILADHDETPEDIARAQQIITQRPDSAGDTVALNERITTGAAGKVFKMRLDVTGIGVSIEDIQAGVL